MNRTRRLAFQTASLAALCGSLGCGRQQASPSPAPVPPEIVVAAVTAPVEPPPIPEPPTPPKPTPKPPAPPPVFPFPTDAAGQALPKVVAPVAPALPSTEKFGAAPQVRTVPAHVVTPEAFPRTQPIAPQLFPPKPVGLRPAVPTEQIPWNLGDGATAVPARPDLPNVPGITQKSRDVNLPPPLTATARPVPDRASLDDPTAEPANGVIVTHSPAVPLPQAGFLRVSLPDPFEFAEQIKAKMLPTAEPAATPVPVNPQRPK